MTFIPQGRPSGPVRRLARLGLVAGLVGAAAWQTEVALAEWPDRLSGHGGPVKSVVIDESGKRLMSTSFDYSARVWHKPGVDGPGKGEPIRLTGHNAAVNDARFLPGNRAVSVADDSDLILWDLESGQQLKRYKGRGEKVLSLEVSPDGRYVAVASWENEARLYDLELQTLEPHAVLDSHRGNVNAVAFSQDGRHLFTASYDGGIRQFTVETGNFERELINLGWGVNALKTLPSGEGLLFGVTDGKVGVLDVETGTESRSLQAHNRPVLSLALSIDGARAATSGGDGVIRVYDTGNWALLEEFQNPYGPVWGLAFTGAADKLFYVGLDDEIHLWQIAPRKPFEPVDVGFPRRFQVSGSEDPGALQFARKCSICHTLTPDGGNRAGPTLYGVFGRKAGSLPGYPYSRALLEADFIWDEKTISNLFDYGPDVVTPGSKMPIQRLKSAADRMALVGYLKRASTPRGASNTTHEGVAR